MLRYEDTPAPDEVLVRVKACALNRLAVRRGIPGQKIPLPLILGSDVSGEVSAVGEPCGRFKVGEPRHQGLGQPVVVVPVGEHFPASPVTMESPLIERSASPLTLPLISPVMLIV